MKIFSFRVVIFVFMSIKYASVKNFTFPPILKSLFVEIMHNIRGGCAALHDEKFTNFAFP